VLSLRGLLFYDWHGSCGPNIDKQRCAPEMCRVNETDGRSINVICRWNNIMSKRWQVSDDVRQGLVIFNRGWREHLPTIAAMSWMARRMASTANISMLFTKQHRDAATWQSTLHSNDTQHRRLQLFMHASARPARHATATLRTNSYFVTHLFYFLASL